MGLTSFETEMAQTGLQFLEGVVSANSLDPQFYLVTPEGGRYALNSHLNRQSLIHMNNQAVRALLRCPPWPRLTSQKPCLHDVLFIERLKEPPELHALEEALPSMDEDLDFEDRWHHGSHNSFAEVHSDYQSSLEY